MTTPPPNTFQQQGVIAAEQMTLNLDYAYYHLFFCLLQPLLLWKFNKTQHFLTAHCFGLFALLMDYGIMYLTKSKRTLSYPNYHGNLDNGFEPLGPIGIFAFFVWFDYSGFNLVLWALHVQEHVQRYLNGVRHQLDTVELIGLFLVPVQFWTAPWLASIVVHKDNRELVLARNSPKMLYMMVVPLFCVLLKTLGKLTNTNIAAVAISGFGCGCIHHLALFTFGLRGYTDPVALVLTLVTEWPALILGVSCFVHVGGSVVPQHLGVRGTTVFRLFMWVGLISAMAPHVSNIKDDDAVAYLMPVVPGQYMQSLGTFFLKAKTCPARTWHPDQTNQGKLLDCWDPNRGNDGTDMLIMASAAKSGAVLSARIVMEVGEACGYCVASGERSRAGIPGPVEDLPSYDGLLLHAIINMRPWPTYVQQQGFVPSLPNNNAQVRCVTMLRDPLARLRSLYLYARSGGEAWFRYESGLMQQLQHYAATESLERSLVFFWNEFGKAYLVQSHEYMVMNLDRGCIGIKMEELKTDYDGNMEKILKVWGMKEQTIPLLVQRLENAELSRKSQQDRAADPHVTSNKFSKQLVLDVVDILNGMKEVKDMVEAHRVELGY